MQLRRIVVGELETNCYFVGAKKGILIDPGGEGKKILKWLKELEVEIEKVVLTHAHPDHWGGIKEMGKVQIFLHPEDFPLLKRYLPPEKGNTFDFFPLPEKIEIEGEIFRIIHTPGHTPGSVCLWGGGALFSGDTLFFQGVGRCDLCGGDAFLLEKSIKEKLLHLPPQTLVYPGHGPFTTIGKEKDFLGV